MFEIIFETVLGILAIYCGIKIGWKNDYESLAIWRFIAVSEDDSKRKFLRRFGVGLLIIGIGCLIMPYLNMIGDLMLGYYIGAALMVIGFVICLLAIILLGNKRNK